MKQERHKTKEEMKKIKAKNSKKTVEGKNNNLKAGKSFSRKPQTDKERANLIKRRRKYRYSFAKYKNAGKSDMVKYSMFMRRNTASLKE